MHIAVLITSFNRKEKTRACLKNLYSQELPDNVKLECFLTDDNSSDGTPEMITSEFPNVHLLHGNGSLYWAGGMRNSWREAQKITPDYYLLLNDDTLLKEKVIKNLIYTERKGVNTGISIGVTADADTGEISYGGWKLTSKFRFQYSLVYDEEQILPCDLGNANIMLVSQGVVNDIGILSDEFTHGIADYDYTLRAKKSGFKVMVLPGISGYCTDDHGKNWKSSSVSLSERIKYLYSIKGLSYKEYLFFIKRHFPKYVTIAAAKLWLKTLFPVLWEHRK